MSSVEPWEKAAECARAIQATVDPQRRAVLANLQTLWIALANQSGWMSAEQLAREAETIGRLHVEMGHSEGTSAAG
jgi:hypothetical protein